MSVGLMSEIDSVGKMKTDAMWKTVRVVKMAKPSRFTNVIRF